MEPLWLSYILLNVICITLSLYSTIAAASDEQIFNHWFSAVEADADGNLQLLYDGNQSSLVLHSCDTNALLYTRRRVFLTRDGFASAVAPLSIPSHLLQDVAGLGSPVFRSATFAGHNLVMAVSGIVFTYDLTSGLVGRAGGIPEGIVISHVASFQCCFNDTEWCEKQDNTVVAYGEHGVFSSDQMEYYLSLDAGRTFNVRHLQLDFGIQNEIFGATILGSIPAVAFLVARDNSAGGRQFVYDVINPRAARVTKPVSLPFRVSGNQTSFMQFESGVGSLVAWDSKDIFYSPTSGKAVVKARIPPLSDGEIVKQVVTNKHGDFAVLTSEDNLYFGREGLPPKLVKLPLMTPLPCPEDSCVVRFTASNNLEVLYLGGSADPSSASSRLHLMSEVIPVQQRLARVNPSLPKCQHQGFVADFHDQVFYLDLGQRLVIRAQAIPDAWQQNSYMVAASNPDVLSVRTSSEGSEAITRGVAVTNLFAHVTLVADALPNGRKDEARGMSTLRMSVRDTSLLCHHKQQAVAHIVAGCPPTRNIRVRKSEDECPDMRDYVYTIDKNAYDPTFLLGMSGVAASEDKTVGYDYDRLGCPIVVYHQDMLKPVIDLYEGDVFVEEVKEDYIVNEIHGIFTYSYAQTAQEAGCKSQPQSWLAQLAAQDEPNPATAWTRQNYRSCMQGDEVGLTNPDQPHEILSGRSDNQLKWNQYNTILVFNVSVLNPDYSLCQLRGQFAVQVYGVLPQSTLEPLRIMLSTCGVGLAALVAFYIVLRLWPTDKEEEVKEGAEDAQIT